MVMKKLADNLFIMEKLHLYIVVCKINVFSFFKTIVAWLRKIASSIILTDGGSPESLDPAKFTGHNFKE